MKQLSMYDHDRMYDHYASPEEATAQPLERYGFDRNAQATVTPISRSESKGGESRKRKFEEGEIQSAPVSHVTEIILSKEMANNMQMVLPMLTQLNSEQRWLAWVNPPVQLLKQWNKENMGFSTKDIMVLRSDENNSACELARKALKAGTSHSVIVWSDSLTNEELASLEQASVEGRSHGIVLRYR